MDALNLPQCTYEALSISICIPAVKVRRGHQLRLIVPGKNSRRNTQAQRDPKLIALIAEALAARKLIEDNREQAIAEGRQPASLSAKMLTKALPHRLGGATQGVRARISH